jgi:hypothetical protein
MKKILILFIIPGILSLACNAIDGSYDLHLKETKEAAYYQTQTAKVEPTDIPTIVPTKTPTKIPTEFYSEVPNPTNVAYVNGFAGSWDTNWGVMTCSVDGQMVKCSYTHDNGKISATLGQDGTTMSGTWAESPSYAPPSDGGRVTFSISGGNTIAGHWWYGQNEGGGTWTGTKK